ncbi:MAG TPA: glycoside hydrolase family 16 protein [Polyangia bacterium]|jgi:beta-glucanase (GH16 family)|nr:glycoside hydrolase family 16 protein [Polyangia bacterium]
MKRRSAFLAASLLSASSLACFNNTPHTNPTGTAGATGSAGATAGSAGATGSAGSGSAGASTTGSAGAAAGGTAGSAGSATGSAGDAMDAGAVVTDADAPDGNPLAGWTLTWSDEFNGATGAKPDPTNWGYDIGGGGWGVSQLQVYTNNAANASMDGNGNLQIVAIKDAHGGFTSARLKTQSKFQQAYGRFEIRVKVVTGNGMWPAFWMLGDDYNGNNWPQCGEIDIMEVRGTRPYNNGGSLHGPGYSGMHPLTGTYVMPHVDGGPSLSDDFHTFAVEWETGVVRFYVDDNLFETHTPADIPADAGANAKWVYDHPFFILLNVAVGGTFPGPPDGTVFPQTMLVDYIRVYSRTNGGG